MPTNLKTCNDIKVSGKTVMKIHRNSDNKVLWRHPFNITYKSGTNASGETFTEIKKFELPYVMSNVSNRFVREDYNHVGWTTVDNGAKQYEFGSTFNGNTDMTFYPAWEEQIPPENTMYVGDLGAMCRAGLFTVGKYVTTHFEVAGPGTQTCQSAQAVSRRAKYREYVIVKSAYPSFNESHPEYDTGKGFVIIDPDGGQYRKVNYSLFYNIEEKNSKLYCGQDPLSLSGYTYSPTYGVRPFKRHDLQKGQELLFYTTQHSDFPTSSILNQIQDFAPTKNVQCVTEIQYNDATLEIVPKIRGFIDINIQSTMCRQDNPWKIVIIQNPTDEVISYCQTHTVTSICQEYNLTEMIFSYSV